MDPQNGVTSRFDDATLVPGHFSRCHDDVAEPLSLGAFGMDAQPRGGSLNMAGYKYDINVKSWK